MTAYETITATGEIDISTIGPIRDALLKSSGPTVILDASGITFIDSGGLRGLLEAKDALAAEFRTLRIIDRPRVLNRLLDIAGLAEEFD